MQIPPAGQAWVNLGNLIHDRVPDENGNLLPVDLTSGTYDVKDLTSTYGSLTVNALAFDQTLDTRVGRVPQVSPVLRDLGVQRECYENWDFPISHPNKMPPAQVIFQEEIHSPQAGPCLPADAILTEAAPAFAVFEGREFLLPTH